MRLVKHGHACLEIIDESTGTDGSSPSRLIIDPGNFAEDFPGIQNVRAVIITHMHDDHCHEPQLDRILAANPELVIYGTDEVCKRLAAVEGGSRFRTVAIHHGDWYELGGFTLEFFGDLHAEIHRSIPLIQNCGVMVNDKLYYPGDSFTLPDRPVALLACPSSAPWLKIGEVMDFVAAVKPARSFPTHNIHLSDVGHGMNNGRIKAVTEAGGGVFEYLQVGDETTF